MTVLVEPTVQRTTSNSGNGATAPHPSGASDRRRFVGQSLALFVGLVTSLAVFLFVGTAFIHNRAQADLAQRFRSMAANLQLPPLYTTDSNGRVTGVAPTPVGMPVAKIHIASIGFDEIALEGSSSTQTLSGPGHVRATPLPGQFGNAVFVCRRTTGGSPCGDLDSLRTGADIAVTTGRGVVHYAVTAVGRTAASDGTVFSTLRSPTGKRLNTLSLVTSDPAITASRRLVVQAELQTEAQGFTPGRVAVPNSDLGLAGDHNAWLPLLLWLEVLLGVSVATVWLFKRWNRGAAWIVSVPVVLCVLWLVFEQFARVLPAAL